MIAKGSDSLKAYVGSTAVDKMYLGDVLVYGGEEEAILPEGYTRLQYIYNTSNAYIDTGVAVGSADKIVFAYKKAVDSSDANDKCIWGARDTTSMYCWVNDYANATQIYFRWGGKASGNYYYDKSSALDITVENGIFTWVAGGTKRTWTSGAAAFQMTTTITLFAQHDGTNGTVRFPCRNRGITHFDIDGKWNGIPCIDPDGVVGMYDTVNQRFHSSPNGTALTAGPVY